MDGSGEEKEILAEIKNIIAQKRSSEQKIQLLEYILVRNKIYIIIFDKELRIIYHNIPSKVPASHLSDFQYLIGANDLKKVTAYLQDPKRKATEDEMQERRFQTQDLAFSFSSHNETFFLQLIDSEHRSDFPSTETIEVLDRASSRLDKIYEIIKALENIRKINLKKPGKNIAKEIIDTHLPALIALKGQLKDPVLKICTDIIETNLKEIVSPDTNIDRSIYHLLTPSEIQIAEFIRMGKSTKDIANALDIAIKTVENHRNNLRNKLGLRNKSVNLRSYLMQLGDKANSLMHS